MKPTTRYGILLVAGIANICIGVYAFILVILRIITGLESLWVILLGLLTSLTGVFLIARMLPTLLRIGRGEPTPLLIDERIRQILYRAGFNTFSYLIIALIITISVMMALPKLGFILTWNEFVTATLITWIIGILVFYIFTAYYSLK